MLHIKIMSREFYIQPYFRAFCKQNDYEELQDITYQIINFKYHFTAKVSE